MAIFRSWWQLIKRLKAPPPITDSPLSPEARLIQSGIFNPTWYKANYCLAPAMSSNELAIHYLNVGWKKGYDPGPLFNGGAYLDRYPDVANATIAPLLHYLLHGINEGRDVRPSNLLGHFFQGRKESFQNYLKTSLLEPVRHAPFDENTKVALAIMEKIKGRFADMAFRLEDPPLVSVIMPVHNRASVVARAIESVLAQTYTNFELIVIDDASVDAFDDVVTQVYDNRVRIIRLSAQVGVSKARNIGIDASLGGLICYLDSDNSWDPQYMACMVGVFEQENTAQIAYCGQFMYECSPNSDSRLSSLRFGPFNISLLEHRNYIDINCLMHRRDLHNPADHWFDPSLTRLVDWDFVLRLTSCNRIVSVPAILSRYYSNPSVPSITRDEPLEENLANLRTNYDELRLRSDGDERPFSRPVSVVVVSFEAIEHLKACVASVLAPNHREHIRLIIVDNASGAEVNAYLRGLPAAVKVHFNVKNYGYSYAVHQGVALTDRDSDIVLLNNDAILAKGALSALQYFAYREPEVGIAVPRQIAPMGHPQTKQHVPYSKDWSECDVNLSSHHANVTKVPLLNDGEIVDLNFSPFFCAYIKREVWHDVGGIDYALGRHYRSDRIMCEAVLTLLNKRIIYVPSARVWHSVQASTEELLSVNGRADYDDMLLKNRWTQELSAELGIERVDWDT